MELYPLLGSALAGLLAGAFAARWVVRHGFATEREQVRVALASARVDLEEAASKLEDFSGRASRQRARAEQSERRQRQPNGESTPKFADARSYQKHLERGGARDPEYEATLGWGRH